MLHQQIRFPRPQLVTQARSRCAVTLDLSVGAACREGDNHARPEANEIILINSHDGASSYQMLAGVLRFVCLNSMVVGDIAHDIRVPLLPQLKEVIERWSPSTLSNAS